MGLPSAPVAVVYTVFSAISALLAVVPATWHYRAYNIPGILLTFWIALGNILNFGNALIWSGPDFEQTWDGAVYCDVQAKILIASGTGTMAAALGIARKLRNATCRIHGGVSALNDRKQRILELAICLAPPLWMMASHIIVQPSRYELMESTGCTPTVDNSWLKIVLIAIWTPILALVASIYCIITTIRLVRHSHEMKRILSSGRSGLSYSRFKRLFGFTFLVVLLVSPTVFYTFVANINHPLVSYKWKDTNGPQWHEIKRTFTDGKIKFDRWVPAAAGIMNFAFFGTGKDATKSYKAISARMGFPRLKALFQDKKKTHARSPVLPFASTLASAATSANSVSPLIVQPQELEQPAPVQHKPRRNATEPVSYELNYLPVMEPTTSRASTVASRSWGSTSSLTFDVYN